MATWNVSPKFLNTKLASGEILDKIDVFEDQIDGWMLFHARALCSDQYQFRPHSGFAVLTLLCPYFEAIEAHYAGRSSSRNSKTFFRRGFLRVFRELGNELAKNGFLPPQPLAEGIADSIYDQLRCGLFHEAVTKNRIVLRQDTAPLGFMLEKGTGGIGCIVIDPCRFLNEVDGHFRSYVAELRNPGQTQLRANFEKLFDLRLSRSGVVLPPPAGTP